MDPDYGGKVEGLKYSYSMKGHMDPDYHEKVEGLKYSYSMKGHSLPHEGTHGPRLWWKGGGA